jgi:hypothetical protein
MPNFGTLVKDGNGYAFTRGVTGSRVRSPLAASHAPGMGIVSDASSAVPRQESLMSQVKHNVRDNTFSRVLA